jgi:hypothetical protein
VTLKIENKISIGGIMKSKALKKRLVLNRETIVDLSETAMGKEYGGVDQTSRGDCPVFCETAPMIKSCGPLSECMCPIETYEC